MRDDRGHVGGAGDRAQGVLQRPHPGVSRALEEVAADLHLDRAQAADALHADADPPACGLHQRSLSRADRLDRRAVVDDRPGPQHRRGDGLAAPGVGARVDVLLAVAAPLQQAWLAIAGAAAGGTLERLTAGHDLRAARAPAGWREVEVRRRDPPPRADHVHAIPRLGHEAMRAVEVDLARVVAEVLQAALPGLEGGAAGAGALGARGSDGSVLVTPQFHLDHVLYDQAIVPMVGSPADDVVHGGAGADGGVVAAAGSAVGLCGAAGGEPGAVGATEAGGVDVLDQRDLVVGVGEVRLVGLDGEVPVVQGVLHAEARDVVEAQRGAAAAAEEVRPGDLAADGALQQRGDGRTERPRVLGDQGQLGAHARSARVRAVGAGG
ncbi:unannotated protein [freshwater metagenome]|uniref:Unannotated protein n=1 Tax=freshwater metagenome TaxID=449393 RepID=A0A6J7FUS0_9ZZZZ